MSSFTLPFRENVPSQLGKSEFLVRLAQPFGCRRPGLAFFKFVPWRTNGQRRLVTTHGVFVPVAYEKVIEAQAAVETN